MDFNTAVDVIKAYTGCGGLLLNGLEQIRDEIEQEAEDEFEYDGFLTQREKAAFYIVCDSMRPMFFAD